MAVRRKKAELPTTLADAMVAGISPLLVVGMVSSLIFFLVAAFYQGEFDTRLMVILGLFTVAAVGIARIALESGRAHANLFSLPLAVVAYLATLRFVEVSGPLSAFSWLINALLLTVTWYMADRITFDCTELDERDRGVRQGLLQSLGLLRKDPTLQREAVSEPASKAEDLGIAKGSGTRESSETRNAKISRRRKRHNPGVWVLYFALLALPLFGLGQLTIPEGTGRNTAFVFLVSYLGCSLALLSTTAFLSTRRYLRHRGVAMPTAMSSKWLLAAILGTATVLLIGLALPLPGRSMGLVGLPAFLGSPEGLQTSRWGWGGESPNDAPEANGGMLPDAQGDASKGERDGGKAETGNPVHGNPGKRNPDQGNQARNNQASQQESNQPGDATQRSDMGEVGAGKNGEGEAGDPAKESNGGPGDKDGSQPGRDQRGAKGDGKQSGNGGSSGKQASRHQQQPAIEPQGGRRDEKNRGEQAPNEREQSKQQHGQSTEPQEQQADPEFKPPATQNVLSQTLQNWMPDTLGEMLKWLTIVILAVIVLLYALTHPREIAQMWRALLELLASLFGWRAADGPAKPAESVAKVKPVVIRPFRSFSNPFAENLRGWSPEQVVLHTFSALESWGAEQGRSRQPDETAAEYAQRLTARQMGLDRQAIEAAQLCDRVLFAGWRPTDMELQPLAQLWRTLQSH